MYADLIRYNKCLLMTKSFIFSLAFNELVPEFGLNNVNMMPVSFTDDQARNNLNDRFVIIFYLMKSTVQDGLTM